MKVIFISRFTKYNKDISLYQPGTDAFFQFGMGLLIAQEFQKRNYPILFEIWRMDMRIKKTMEKKIDDILCRIFPSKKIKIFGEYSKEINIAFRQEAKNREVVFHFMPNHPLNFHYFAWIVRNNKVVSTHLGGPNPYWQFKNERRWSAYLRFLLEKYLLLKPYNHIITICKPEAEYYKMVNVSVSHMPIFGITREHLFTIKDRTKSKIKLNLPLNKKILLQVGRAVEVRGFDWIMELIDYYQKLDNIFLVFVGINKEDEYYNSLLEKKVYMTQYINQAELPDYYNAADLLFYLPHGEMDLNFAGTSYVPLEALACGTPVVATTLHHFPDNEIYEVSRIPRYQEDVIPMIEDLLISKVSRKRCREIALKHFSWKKIIKKHWEIYNI